MKTKLKLIRRVVESWDVVNADGQIVFSSSHQRDSEYFIRRQELRCDAVKSAAKYFTSSGPMDVSDKD